MNGEETKYFNEKFNTLTKEIDNLKECNIASKTLLSEIKTENRILWQQHTERSSDFKKVLGDDIKNLKKQDKDLIDKLSIIPLLEQQMNSNKNEIHWNKRIYISGLLIMMIGALVINWLGI